MKKKLLVTISATFIVVFASLSQGTSDLYEKGLALEKEFRDQEAVEKYQQVLDRDPAHPGALVHASRMLSNLAGRETNNYVKKEYAERARVLAQKAMRLDNTNKEAHLNYVIALGLLAEAAGSAREKIQHAKSIKQEALTLLTLDSMFAPAFYILGKWNLSLATLSWFEKLTCQVLFGEAFEDATLEKAAHYFERAITLQPESILFHYNRALAYYYSGNPEEAYRSLHRAMKLRQREPDDKIRLNQCVALLNDIKNNEH